MSSEHKLKNKVILITNGNDNFAKKLSMDFAKEGAHIILCCPQFNEKAVLNKFEIENENVDCVLLVGNVNDQKYCKEVKETIQKAYGKLDVLVNNNLAPNYPLSALPKSLRKELISISKMGIFSFQKLTETLLPIMAADGNIINNQVLDETLEVLDDDVFPENNSLKMFTEFYSNRLLEHGIKSNAILYPEHIMPTASSIEINHTFMDRDKVIQEQAGCPFIYLASNISHQLNGKILKPRTETNNFSIVG